MSIANPIHACAEALWDAADYTGALQTAIFGLSLNQNDPTLLLIAARSASACQQAEAAIDFWERLIKLDYSAAYCNELALLLGDNGQPAAAEKYFRRAIEDFPGNAMLHSNLGLLLEAHGRLQEALVEQETAHALAPDSAQVLCNLAGALAAHQDYAQAEGCYRQAITLQPGNPIIHSNLGILLADQQQDLAAEHHLKIALTLRPDYRRAALALAQTLFAQGRFIEGWPLLEVQSPSPPPGNAPIPVPEWRGEPLLGKSIVILPEAGFGDCIQFCRYLPWLRAQNPARITLVCQRELKRLFSSLAGPHCLLTLEEAENMLPAQDYRISLLSLCRQAGSTLDTIPQDIPYLRPPSAVATRQPARKTPSGKRIALVWRGNPKHNNDQGRSLPSLDTLRPIWSLPGHTFYSLQKPGAPGSSIPGDCPVTDLAPQLEDFADTAALLLQMDLLITVDSAVAHLAGALGIPCWILLPARRTDWRWLRNRQDSPWYPHTRLFRQTEPGNWLSPIEQMVSHLHHSDPV